MGVKINTIDNWNKKKYEFNVFYIEVKKKKSWRKWFPSWTINKVIFSSSSALTESGRETEGKPTLWAVSPRLYV